MPVPKLNIAIPSPASDNIDIDPFIIEGIWMFHLKIQKQIVLINQHDNRIMQLTSICMCSSPLEMPAVSSFPLDVPCDASRVVK